jgi:hypothetical protein
MSEWLTTEQMIVKLVQLDPFTVFESEEGETVAKNRVGTIRYCDSHGNTSGETVQLNFEFMRKKWRILPRYVSFEEAMKALREGKVVTLHVRDIEHSFSTENYFRAFVEKGISIADFVHGKWTIED